MEQIRARFYSFKMDSTPKMNIHGYGILDLDLQNSIAAQIWRNVNQIFITSKNANFVGGQEHILGMVSKHFNSAIICLHFS